MKTVFWDVAPNSLLEVYRCIRGAYCLHTRVKTLKCRYFFQTIRRNGPEGRLGGVLVTVTAIGPTVPGFKPGRGDGFLRVI
jgi:hypothetical protein